MSNHTTTTTTDYTAYKKAMSTPAPAANLNGTMAILEVLLEEAADAVERAHPGSELDAAQLRRREILKAIDGVINTLHAN